MLKQRQFTLRARAKVPNRPPPQLLSAMSLIFPTKMVSLSLLITKIRFRHVPKIFTSKVCWCAHEKHLTIICLAEATIPADKKKLLGHNPMSALARVSKNQCDNDIKINTQKLACNLNEVTAAAAMFFGLRLVIGFGKMSIRSNDAVNRRYARVYECVCVCGYSNKWGQRVKIQQTIRLSTMKFDYRHECTEKTIRSTRVSNCSLWIYQ